MGDRDSSKTRVEPIFDKLYARDRTGQNWISELLRLPELTGGEGGKFDGGNSTLEAYGWGKREKKLAPPRVLLQWLAACAERPRDGNLGKGKETIEKRTGLLMRDKVVIGEALALLSRPTLPRRDWYILEGHSQPDVYLQTPDFIVVIEGKRTERGPICKTKWMLGRDQMIRHLDCAWEIRGSRKVFGFFLVEGEGGAAAFSVPPIWNDAASRIITDESLEVSLPHRTEREREEIRNGFLGVTTWQMVCSEMSMDWDELPFRLERS